MAISTFVGCVTGSIVWLHFGLLAVWALAGGLLVALGNRGGVIGTQAMIAFVVFGRFSQPAAAVARARRARARRRLRPGSVPERRPLADAAAGTARGDRQRLPGAVGARQRVDRDLDIAGGGRARRRAGRACRRRRCSGIPALMTLRSLVNEGLRMRVQLSAIHSLVSRRQAEGGDPRSRGGAHPRADRDRARSGRSGDRGRPRRRRRAAGAHGAAELGHRRARADARTRRGSRCRAGSPRWPGNCARSRALAVSAGEAQRPARSPSARAHEPADRTGESGPRRCFVPTPASTRRRGATRCGSRWSCCSPSSSRGTCR